jgi:hypothetical protein
MRNFLFIFFAKRADVTSAVAVPPKNDAPSKEGIKSVIVGAASV